MEKVIIVGSGPAGHTAAIYAARAGLQPLMFEGFMAGGVPAGGQLMITTEVENYPGFPEGVTGPELMTKMREQSVKYGTRIETKNVTGVEIKQHPFKVFVDSAAYVTQTIIIATGATAKRLHVPGEERLWQKGISACAVCDGALPIFRDKILFVVGGGDTAVEEALYLTKFAKSVTMVVRRDVLRASKAMQNRVGQHEKINQLWRSNVIEALGDTHLTQLRIKNNQTGKEEVLDAGGLFYAIGHTPNTDFLKDQIELKDNGYIQTKPGSTATNVPGVFACGDVQDHTFRQAVTAAGSGCMAALEAERYLADVH